MSWLTQSDDNDSKVLVSSDYCRDGEVRTDFLVIDKSNGSHSHVSVDLDGNQTTQHDYKKEAQKMNPEQLCHKIISVFSIDEKISQKLETDDSLESKIFNLAVKYLDQDVSATEKADYYTQIQSLLPDWQKANPCVEI